MADFISDLRVELADFIPALRSQGKLRVETKEMSQRKLTHSELTPEEAIVYRLLWSKEFEQ